MSVVNDMLKDLEARDSISKGIPGSGKIAMNEDNPSDAVNDSLAEEIYLQRRKPRPGMGSLWIITTAVFLLCLAGGWWFLYGGKASVNSETDPASELLAADVQGLNNVEVTEDAVAQEPSVEVRNQVVELPSEEPVIEEPIAEVVSVEQLLAEAELALEVDRLTTPPGDNAYDRFQAVLVLQPDNQQAQRGLEKIQQRYLGFVKSLIERKEFYAIPTLVQKAREVGVDEQTVQSLLGQVKEAEEAEKLGKLMKAFEPVERKKDVSVNTIEPSLQERDRLVSENAEQLIGNQHLVAAEKLLTDFLKENPKAVASVSQLFAVYLQQNRLDDAETLINQAQHLPGFQFSYMVAQVLIKRQDLAGALRALQSQQPPLASAPAYYALQAGLYHQRGENDKAVQLYQSLINLDGTQASYWLGLAVSLDSLGLTEPTLNAFRKTIQYSKPTDNYIPYVQRRIEALKTGISE